MLKVGLTGNIGSGKTTVACIFASLGINVFFADKSAKLLYKKQEIKEELKTMFGESIIDENNNVILRELAHIVFNNNRKLNLLNSFIHPMVRKEFETFCDNNIKEPYIIEEAAILFETGYNKYCDKVITVAATKELMIQRVVCRDKADEKKVIARLKNQLSQKEKINLSDYIIYNNDEHFVIPQVLEIHKNLLSLINK